MLRAGLATAGWVSVDDTGARHKHQNGVCTQLGNDHFAAFATTASKSRLNFLEVLRAGFTDANVHGGGGDSRCEAARRSDRHESRRRRAAASPSRWSSGLSARVELRSFIPEEDR